MSREQAGTYHKFRDADDPMGNLGWAAKLTKKAVRQAPEAPADVESSFQMSADERLLWRLLKIPRRYIDVENAGIFPSEKIRGILRGLISADVLDICEATDGKPLVPMEINRIRRALAGKDEKVDVVRKSFEDRVFRPDIGLNAPAPEPVQNIPAPIEFEPKPVVAAPKRLSVDDMRLKEKILKEHTERYRANHYKVLGVDPMVSAADIKKGYMTLARAWHPDIVSGTGLADDDEFKTKLDQLFKRLQDAYDVLGDADSRLAYDRSGAATRGPTDGKKVRRTAEANVACVKAETFFKKREWKQAETHYRLAMDFDEEDVKFRIGYAWAVFHNDGRDKKERIDTARKTLREITNSAKSADACYKLGLIARVEGKEDEAVKRFSEAFKLDPNHSDIAREYRLIKMRLDKAKEQDAKKGGIFGKFK